jgi:hypothetical protein
MKGLTFGKTILLVIGAAALALFSCLGALTGSNSALVVGGTGFAVGVIALLFGLLRLFYLTVVWLVSLGRTPPQNPSA